MNQPHTPEQSCLHVLFVNQFYWPDEAATSQFLTDLTRHVAAEGHQVTVICGQSRYAKEDSSAAPPVRIVRVPNFSFGTGTAARGASYLSFFAGAAWRMLGVPRPDIVVTMTTPPLLSLLGTFLRKMRGSRHFSWEMDLYPDVALDLGFLNGESRLTRLVARLSDYAFARTDGVIALGECMRDRLLARGVPAAKIHIAENWSDLALERPVPASPNGHLTLIYSGNLGQAHEVDSISAAIDQLKDDHRFRFVFAGGGSNRPALETFCRDRGIFNVSFLGYQRQEHLAAFLSRGDVGLVTQKASCAGSVVPSKVYGLMAAGRPVLFVGPPAATPARIIRRFQCGWHVDCGRPTDLVTLLHTLAETPELVRQAGARARQAFLEHYHLRLGVSRICQVLGIGARDLSAQPVSEAGARARASAARAG